VVVNGGITKYYHHHVIYYNYNTSGVYDVIKGAKKTRESKK